MKVHGLGRLYCPWYLLYLVALVQQLVQSISAIWHIRYRRSGKWRVNV